MNLIPEFIQRRIAHRPNLVKIVDNIGWLFFDKILRMGVGLFVGVWIARYLGPEQFGLFNFAAAFVGLFATIAGLGLQSIVVRDIVRNPACTEKTLGTAAALQFCSGLCAYGLIISTIFWLRSDDVMAKLLVAVLGTAVLFKASEVAVYWFESQVLSKYTVWVQNVCFVGFAAMKVLFVLKSAPLLAFALATMAEAIVVAILMLVMLNLHGPNLRQLRITATRAKELLADSWPLLLSGIAIMIYMKIDQVMLGQMVDDEAVGIYSVAVRISEVWYFIPIMIAASVFPAILETKKRSEGQYYKRLQYLYDLVTWLSICVALPMTFLSSFVVILLFGEAYAAAGGVLAIHVWAGLFVSMGVARGKWLLAENLQNIGYWYIGLGMITNVVCNYLAIPYFGMTGAAFTTLISQAVTAIIAPALFQKTRISSWMLLSSLNPTHCYRLIRSFE
ncbi:MAG: flippase [Halieaceae bacterium]